MKINIKLKNIVILSIVGLCLVLSATFFYINNDLVISKVRKVATPNSVVTEEGDKGAGTTDEASLDAVFDVDESADNFDDIVM